jgi:formylglycine-generating enzyme required for sulfatase activity
VFLASLLPGSVAARPFDLERARRAVVRVFGDGGNVVGSGSVVSVADGRAYILTSYHVVRADHQRGGTAAVQVEFFPDATAEARISRDRVDPTNDLAVLVVDKLPASPPLAIQWGSSGDVPDTERVWALGHPRGGPGWYVSDGTIGRKTGGRLYFSGTAAAAGNSGGPLLDGRGALVGVIIGEGSSGVAVEADVVRPIIRNWVPAAPAGPATPAPPSRPEAKPAPPSSPTSGPPSTITGKDGSEMVLVPAGEFWMGSDENEYEKPRHRVMLDDFYIDRYEATNALYHKFVSATGRPAPALSKDNDFNGSRQPVVGVSWDDADAYCRFAGKRLPTEAEWEKAARGTDGRRYPWGDQWEASRANSTESRRGRPADVGSYPTGASPYGALDMAGNVEEWVADWYTPDYYARSPKGNPKGPEAGTYRVVRGGSWSSSPIFLRAAFRSYYPPVNRRFSGGFRCARGLFP